MRAWRWSSALPFRHGDIDARKFGPIGIIFALLSYLIAIGVVVILGAAVGLVWQERGLSFAAVLRKLRRAW
jgi:membrane protein